MSDIINTTHPIEDPGYIAECRAELEAKGALVLDRFFSSAAIEQIVEQSLTRATRSSTPALPTTCT